MAEVNAQRRIPLNEIEQCISEDYKHIIHDMRGERKDNAFSNYSRFTPLNKFELEAIEERSKYSFSVIDTSSKLCKRVVNYPHF